MRKPIDISVRLHERMPLWPGSPGVRVSRTRSFEAGDEVTESRLDMDVHCGTHVEGSMHLIAGGDSLQTIPLDAFVGLAWVADLRGTREIGVDDLESSAVPADIERLLIRTNNSELWSDERHTFRRDFAALTADGATWVVDHGIRLVGLDYLSVQLYDDDLETHRILMRAGVAILEGLNLASVASRAYRLTCLPLSLSETEAAPARAILEELA